MKILRCVLIGCLCFASPVFAQEDGTVDKILEHARKGEVVPVELIQQATREQNEVQANIDLVLKQLLSVPFEQRQYIFPALFDTPAVPKKIRTHPEIAIWEGKLPTDIAPEAQEYASQYLKNLNPKMFLYLSPDYYGQKSTDGDIASPSNDLTLAVRQAQPSLKVVGDMPKYLSVRELFPQPPELSKNPNKHVLTEEHIKKLGIGLNAFNTFLNRGLQEDPAFRSSYNMLKLLHTDRDAERINPFQEKLERIRLLKKEEDLDRILKQAGWKNAAEFVAKADAMVHAYRAARMSLQTAFNVRRYRGEKPTNDMERIVVTGSNLYRALPADTRLVADHLAEVRKAFVNTGYQSVLNTETTDEYKQ